MKTPRKTHPEAPLFYPPQIEIDQETGNQLSVDFTQITGQIADAQVPQSAVTQHKAAVLASAALTGTPTAPTAALGTNTAQVATTAFVIANAGGGGGGSPPARSDVVITTASIANLATDTGVIVLGKSSLIVRFQSSHPCRIRLYSTAAYRTADAARISGVDPQGEHGLLLDITVVLGNQTWDLAPQAPASNGDDPAVTDIYYAVQNMNGSTAAITVTITRIPMET